MTDRSPYIFTVDVDPDDRGALKAAVATLEQLSGSYAGISFQEVFTPSDAPSRPIGSLAVVTGDTVDPIDGERWYHGFAPGAVVRIVAEETELDGTYLVESDDRPEARWVHERDLADVPAPSVVVREPVLPSQETRDRYHSELRRLEGRNAFVIGDRVRKWSASHVFFDGDAGDWWPLGRPAPRGATGEVLATFDDGDVTVQWDGLAGACYSTLIAGHQLRKVNR